MAVRVVFYPEFTQLAAGGQPYFLLLRSLLEQSGVEFVHTDSAPFSRNFLVENRNRIQVLHFHFIQQAFSLNDQQVTLKGVLRFAFLLYLAKALGYKTIFTLHNLFPTYARQPYWLDYLGHWAAANLTDQVIVHCSMAKDLLQKVYGRTKNVVVIDHPGLAGCYPNSVSRKTAREKLGLSSQNIVFLFLGGIRPNKGIEKLIQAFHNVPGENCTLVIAGKPWPPQAYWEQLLKDAADDARISFHFKHIPDDELQNYYNSADVVVLPFTRILTSGSTILAMSFKKPVIVPRMGCLPELVTPDCGWLYEPGNVDSLTRAIETAAHGDLQRSGECAFSRVQITTPEAAAAKTFALYQRYTRE